MWHRFHHFMRGRLNRHGLVGGPVNHQRGHSKAGQIRTEVGGAKRFGRSQCRAQPRLHRAVPRQIERFVADRAAHHAHAEEVLEEPAEEMRTIGLHAGGHFIERGLRHTSGIVRGLQHVRHYRTDQRNLADTFAVMA